MTLNIAHGRGLSFYQGFHSSRGIRRNLSRIARLLDSAQPDIVALQEVDEASHWNRHLPLLDLIQRESGFPFCQVGVHNRRSGKRPLAYGNAILSRFPLADIEIYPFGNRDLGEKGFMTAWIELPGRPIPIINLHLDYKSRKTRREQADQITAFIVAKNFEVPPVICGDFNAQGHVDQDAVAYLLNRLKERVPYQMFPRKARTWPAFLPAVGIDFILLPSLFQMMDVRVLPSLVSDHRPVQVEFTWR